VANLPSLELVGNWWPMTTSKFKWIKPRFPHDIGYLEGTFWLFIPTICRVYPLVIEHGLMKNPALFR
jgi:hypothetical protein